MYRIKSAYISYLIFVKSAYVIGCIEAFKLVYVNVMNYETENGTEARTMYSIILEFCSKGYTVSVDNFSISKFRN